MNADVRLADGMDMEYEDVEVKVEHGCLIIKEGWHLLAAFGPGSWASVFSSD